MREKSGSISGITSTESLVQLPFDFETILFPIIRFHPVQNPFCIDLFIWIGIHKKTDHNVLCPILQPRPSVRPSVSPGLSAWRSPPPGEGGARGPLVGKWHLRLYEAGLPCQCVLVKYVQCHPVCRRVLSFRWRAANVAHHLQIGAHSVQRGVEDTREPEAPHPITVRMKQ